MRDVNVCANEVKFFVLLHKFTVTEKLQFVNRRERRMSEGYRRMNGKRLE